MDVLADSPIKGIAVVSAVMKADDPCAAAAHIKEKFLKMMNKSEKAPKQAFRSFSFAGQLFGSIA